MYKIYKYTNIINNKIYIGQTKNTLEKRAGANGINYKECTYFYNAIQKYGWENFKPEILKDNLTVEEANYWEEYYISFYNSTNRSIGYNISLGGLNRKLSEEQKENISKKAKERMKNKENNPMYGKKHSIEALEKMKNKKLGENNPMYGKHVSQEAKEKANDTKRKNNSFYRPVYTEEDRLIKSILFKKVAEQFKKRVHNINEDLYFDSITECSNYYNIPIPTISDNCHGRSKTCRGMKFEFVE